MDTVTFTNKANTGNSVLVLILKVNLSMIGTLECMYSYEYKGEIINVL